MEKEKSAFAVGDKIEWTALLDGKQITISGKVVEIVDGQMMCIGQCTKTGNWWRDYLFAPSIKKRNCRTVNV